jgi:tellurite resistance protein TerC
MTFAVEETQATFVSLDVQPWAWAALILAISVMLAVDLFRHRDDHEPSPREALRESLVWIALGLSFGGVVLATFGAPAFGEYLSGYLIEKSLSVDNFVTRDHRWVAWWCTLAEHRRNQRDSLVPADKQTHT